MTRVDCVSAGEIVGTLLESNRTVVSLMNRIFTNPWFEEYNTTFRKSL